MPGKNCMIPNCPSKGNNKLYNIPKDKRLADAWHNILLSKFPGIKISSGVKRIISQKICELHFESIFIKSERRKINAIPTLFTQEEIRVGKPSKPINIDLHGFECSTTSTATTTTATTTTTAATATTTTTVSPKHQTTDSENDVTEGTPPLAVTKGSKRRRIDLSTVSDVVQVEHTPTSPVWADIELIGFPSHSDNGSDMDDDPLDERECRKRVAGCEDDPDEVALAEDIKHIDAEADVALRSIVDPEQADVLSFDWRGDADNFTGVREKFIGLSGPTFEASGLTPLNVFKKIWDENIIEHIVRETNRYASQMMAKGALKTKSRMNRWTDTCAEEMWRFLIVIMLQSLLVTNVEREYWYPASESLRIGVFGKIMSFNRFVLLKRCLHFVDNSRVSETPSRLDKIMPVITHLNKKFSTLYLPEQNVAIDESLLLWKGRLSFAQMIATKRAKVGIKSYEVCESRTGYMWKMEVYSGKGHVQAPQETPQGATVRYEDENEPENATSRIVYNLMRPLFGRGHTLVMDNFYNAPLLSRLLKSKNTDTMGTLRLNREFVPETLKCKNKSNMKTGEVCFSTTKDLSVVVWRDNNTIVPMISTYHRIGVGGKEKYGYYKFKPKVVLDYNLSMGGVDHKDQMLHAYPIERSRNCCWYKKLFRRLVNVSVHNALVIYDHGRTGKNQLGNRNFRVQLMEDMMRMYSPEGLESSTRVGPPSAVSQFHLPAKNRISQRCKLCYMRSVKRTTVWRCGACAVNLCIEGCYTAYHAQYVNKEAPDT